MLTAMLAIAADIITVIKTVSKLRRKGDRPYKPSVVIVDTIPMNRHIRDLPGHGMSSKARVL